MNKSSVEDQVSIWSSFFNEINISEETFVYNELYIRSNNHFQKLEHYIIRPSFNYKLKESIVTSIGYTFAQFFRNNQDKEVILEHAVWEQITFKYSISNFHFQHRVRWEHRFLNTYGTINRQTDFLLEQRWRYRLSVVIPFKKQPKYYGQFHQEIHLNPSKLNSQELLIQNRLFLALGYKINSDLQFQLGYQCVFNKASIPDSRNHTLQIVLVTAI